MGLLRNLFPRLIDDGERQALSIMDEVNRAFDNFDFDATIDSIMESGKNAIAGFNDFIKTVKDSVSDFRVIIPFNEKKEEFKYDIEGNILKVTVCSKNCIKNFSKRETTVTIPGNCMLDKISHTVDKKHGNLIVTIPKNVAEDENLKKIKDTFTDAVNDTTSWLKDALKERAEAVAASTTPPTSKAKTKKKTTGPKPQPKVVRGKDGKFTSAKKGSK